MSELINNEDSEGLVTEDHNHVVIDIDQIPSTYFEEPNSLESGTTCSLDSYRPIHSLLLCPSQWSTFLEHSPVSLVRQSTDSCELEGVQVISTQAEATPSGLDSICELIIDDEAQDNSISTPLLDRSTTDSTTQNGEDMKKQSSNTTIEAMDQEGYLTSVSNREESHSNDFQPPSCSGPLSSVTITYNASEISSQESCTVGSSFEQLTRGGETPSPALRSSPPQTPQSGTRLPYTMQTGHSRNISETPSLPPFMSSTSSSAYHSRNSSLASQITSELFDSDSQYTDIDSCIVMYSKDIQRPISLQDARFKFPDTTSLEEAVQRQHYSFSDLNLTSPICVPEHLFVPSPSLEDTLQTGEGKESVSNTPCSPTESFEEKHLASALKSSEWIKREMRRARQSMIQVKVSSKTRHVVHFNVKAWDMIIWEFATKKKDVGFGLSFEATEVATVESPEPCIEEGDDTMTPILPLLRINSHTHPVVGSHIATQDGIYEIIFDNSYSRFFAKDLFYRITTKPSIPNEHYLDQ